MARREATREGPFTGSPMRGCGALIAAVLLCSCVVRVRCDAASASPSSSTESELEIQRLRSKIASLEDEINGRKDETLQLESIVREKTAQMATLVGDLDVLQVTNVVDDESVMKASANTAMLEEEIERLGNDLEDQVKKGESLEARASNAEQRLLELGRKLDRFDKINIEQKQRIEELDKTLQQAKDKLSKVQRDAKLKAEELAKVHGMWFPYWFSARSVHCQELASTKWKNHGKPVFDALTQKVTHKLAHAQRLAEPHLEATQNKLVPVAKAHLDSLKNSKVYRVCGDAMQVLEHYMAPVTSSWRWLVMWTSIYHRRAQRGISHFMQDNELLKPLAAGSLVWLMASSLFVLPLFSIYKIFSGTICGKIQATRSRGWSRFDK